MSHYSSDLIAFNVLEKNLRFVTSACSLRRESRLQNLDIFANELGDTRCHPGRIRAIFENELDVERRPILDENLSVAVKNDSSRRRNKDRPQPIIL
jgi:hypothetical protein